MLYCINILMDLMVNLYVCNVLRGIVWYCLLKSNLRLMHVERYIQMSDKMIAAVLVDIICCQDAVEVWRIQLCESLVSHLHPIA